MHFFFLTFQAFWICCEETRKHNRQCQSPVCRAGPGSTRFSRHQLRLQNDGAVKRPPAVGHVAILIGVFLRKNSITSLYVLLVPSWFVSFLRFFLSSLPLLCLVGLTESLKMAQIGARGRVLRSRERDEHEGRYGEK